MKKTLVVFLILFCLSSVLAVVIGFFLFFDSVNPSASQYKPKFEKSPFELVRGDGFPKAHLYYKTKKHLTIGQSVDAVTVIVATMSNDSGTVSPDNASEKKKFKVTVLNNRVDEIGDGYVTFFLDDNNFDCLAVYENKKLIPITHIEFSLLPTPSDAWMCQGYNFNQ